MKDNSQTYNFTSSISCEKMCISIHYLKAGLSSFCAKKSTISIQIFGISKFIIWHYLIPRQHSGSQNVVWWNMFNEKLRTRLFSHVLGKFKNRSVTIFYKYQMKEEVQFNKGSHKLKPLQPEDYLQPSRCSTSLQLMKKINLRRESEPEISSGKIWAPSRLVILSCFDYKPSLTLKHRRTSQIIYENSWRT